MNRVVLQIALGISLAAAGYAVGRAQGSTPLTSGVVQMSQTQVADSGPWGVFRRHFGGSTTATADVLSGVVELKPGQEPHPPHTHPDEEFLYVIEGSGTWSLEGRTIPLKTGDVLYTAPNDEHGLKNTGDTTLRFFVAKWRTK